jgi:hypothetical protein
LLTPCGHFEQNQVDDDVSTADSKAVHPPNDAADDTHCIPADTPEAQGQCDAEDGRAETECEAELTSEPSRVGHPEKPELEGLDSDASRLPDAAVHSEPQNEKVSVALVDSAYLDDKDAIERSSRIDSHDVRDEIYEGAESSLARPFADDEHKKSQNVSAVSLAAKAAILAAMAAAEMWVEEVDDEVKGVEKKKKEKKEKSEKKKKKTDKKSKKKEDIEQSSDSD